ncbi:hypothetical protein F5Y01DRAFT_274926 [Xylaria sp. FL0043]|nr:hypothetical protein F5Y01DRAFT_274926 [Xylaria sp. FL0043]
MAQQQAPTQLLKFTVQHYKSPNVSDDAFMKWYQEEHRPRMVKLVHKHNVARYALFLTPSFLRNGFQEDLQKFRGKQGWKMADFDVTTTYWVKDPEHLRNMLSDPEWDAQVQDLEEGWVDQERALIQVGWETVYVEDGQVIEPKA